MKKRVFSVFLFIFFMIIGFSQNKVYATQSMSGNFWGFTKTGDMANDIASCAEAQGGRSQSSMGYTEDWCADFVSDCAKLVGASNVIPADGYVPTFYNAVINAGGTRVSSPQRGDLVFYWCNNCNGYKHVGIMTSSTQSAEGNYWYSNYGQVATGVTDYYDDCDHRTTWGQIVKVYVRPNYPSNKKWYDGMTKQNIGDDVYAKIIINKAWIPLVDVGNGKIELRKESNIASEMWHFEKQSDGFYKIKNCGTGKYLDVYGAQDANGTVIQTYESNTSDAQKWEIYGQGSGDYKLKPKCSDRVLDIKNGSLVVGNSPQLWEYNGSNAQLFAIYKYEPAGKATITVNKGDSESLTTIKWNKVSNATSYNLIIRDITSSTGHLSYIGKIYKEVKNLTGTSYSLKLPVGNYRVYVYSCNYYSKTMSSGVKFTVEKGYVNINNCTIIFDNKSSSKIDNKVYTGKAITPLVTIKNGSTVLKNGTDYTVSYFNNINVGTGTVQIIGKGDYTGTVTKTFNIVKNNTAENNVTANKNLLFKDVASNDWYYGAVQYTYENKIISGYNDYTFAPNDKLTRGMIVTILYRMEGSPNNNGQSKFSDVSSNQWYSKAIKWAVDNGIVHGYGGTNNFGPNDNIIRQDLAGILRNYANYKKKNTKITASLLRFKDSNQVDSYAKTSMEWAVGAGVITGNADGTLNPKGNATRAEAAAMIQKYCNKVGR